ncbi:hypothetical protein D3C87_1603150 [compost metagenome]
MILADLRVHGTGIDSALGSRLHRGRLRRDCVLARIGLELLLAGRAAKIIASPGMLPLEPGIGRDGHPADRILERLRRPGGSASPFMNMVMVMRMLVMMAMTGLVLSRRMHTGTVAARLRCIAFVVCPVHPGSL